MFGSDYPRGVVNCLWLRWFPAFDAFAITPALTVPLLSPCRRFPVSLLVLPPRPLPRRFPALFAAITLACLPGTKSLLASLQQTPPFPRPAGQPPPPSRLIFGMRC